MKDSAELTILHSIIDRPTYDGNNHLPGTSSNAAFCVVSLSHVLPVHVLQSIDPYIAFQTNHSSLYINYGSVTSSGNLSTGVWVFGDNAEARLTSLAVVNSGSSPTYGLMASHKGHIYANNIQYNADNAGACGFVSDGGILNIGQSKAHTKSVGSSVFCSVDSKHEAEIYAEGVVATSDSSAAV